MFKVELRSLEDKILALHSSSMNLRNYREYGNRVTVRSSTSFENRVAANNLKTLLNQMGMSKSWTLNKHSHIVQKTQNHNEGLSTRNYASYKGIVDANQQTHQIPHYQPIRLPRAPRFGMNHTQGNAQFVDTRPSQYYNQ